MSAINSLKSKKVQAVLAIIVVVVGVIVILKRPQKVSAPAASIPVTATVRINEDGFVPETLKIKKGTVVIWKNEDSDAHRIAANPFGSHSDLPTLDSKTNVATNGTYRFSFDISGTFHYHDELHPTTNGTIVVE